MDIEVQQFSGAMTNLVYKCETNTETCKLVALARVHASEDQLFERESELAAFVAVGKSGLGPKLLGLFGNGRIEEFLIDHYTLSASDIHDGVMSPAVAEAMANFHFLLTQQMSRAQDGAEGQAAAAHPIVWSRIRHWLELTQRVWGDAACELDLGDIAQELDALERLLPLHHPVWTAFCHNDLQYGNIMKLPSRASPPAALLARHPSDDTSDLAPPATNPSPSPSPSASAPPSCLSDPIVLIDYEYAGFNPIAFDIANHWCEWAADYHTATPHLLDFSKFPTPAEQRVYVSAYLARLLHLVAPSPPCSRPPTPDGHADRDVDAPPLAAPTVDLASWMGGLALGGEPDEGAAGDAPGARGGKARPLAGLGSAAGEVDAAVEHLVAAANEYVCLSHLLWALWGFIQSKISAVEFDFMSYGSQRMALYRAAKAKVLGAAGARRACLRRGEVAGALPAAQLAC